MKRVEIEFADSNIMHGWESMDEIDYLANATAIGYLKSEDDEQITIVMAKSEMGSVFEKFSIPKAATKSIKELRLR